MKYFFIALLLSFKALADCPKSVDLLIVGDSQVGAAWSQSYVGNFLPTCLKGNFVLYGRGGTVPSNWMGLGGMDQVETIQRDPNNGHLNIGSGLKVPQCKKRFGPMLDAHTPKKLLLEFGGNYTSTRDEEIARQILSLKKLLIEKGIAFQNCYFLTPTFEMAVESRRNIPLRDLANVNRITKVIENNIGDVCQIIKGTELMSNSSLFDGKELLKRIQIPGKSGCGGAAANDNVHVCGEAARDMAQRVCEIIND